MVNATPFTITFTTAAFDRSSLWLFEASSYTATPKGQPSSLVQLRTAVWTGVTRDTRPIPDLDGSAARERLIDHFVSGEQEAKGYVDSERSSGLPVDCK